MHDFYDFQKAVLYVSSLYPSLQNGYNAKDFKKNHAKNLFTFYVYLINYGNCSLINVSHVEFKINYAM